MANEVTAVLAELREDHKNMALCLDLLERESERIHSNDEADFELVQDIISYMTNYSDAVHHPKEDRLYAELKSARPDLSQGFERISSEHGQLAERGLELRADLASIVSGSYVKRSKVVADALRYIEALRKHMHWEEKDLFRRCQTMAEEGHDLYVTDSFIERRDPVFGKQTGERYRRLFDSLRDLMNT